MGSIRVSEKYGVNPAIPICFYCGEQKNEIILAGRLPGDREAPRNAVWNMEPCDECKAHMANGIILISVRAGSDPKNPDRTGGWVVVKEEAYNRIFGKPTRRVAFVEDAAWDKIGLPRGEA